MNTVVRQTFRMITRSVVFVISAGLLIAASALMTLQHRNAADVMSSALVIVLLAVPVFVFGAGLIGPEIASGSLLVILLRPISRPRYLTARVVGTLLSVATLFVIAAAATLLLHLAKPDLGHALFRMAIGFIGYVAEALFVLSMFALFGSLASGYFNVGCYFLWCVFIMEGLGALAVGLSAAGLSDADRFFESPAADSLMQSTFMAARDDFNAAGLFFTLAWAACALLLACLSFSRRELALRTE